MAASPKLACALVLCIMMLGAPMASAITCGQVISAVEPCYGYIRFGGFVPSACCSGMKSLINLARNTPDRQTACNCLKTAAGAVSGLNPALAIGLPGKCGLNIPYKITPSTDCKSVK